MFIQVAHSSHPHIFLKVIQINQFNIKWIISKIPHGKWVIFYHLLLLWSHCETVSLRSINCRMTVRPSCFVCVISVTRIFPGLMEQCVLLYFSCCLCLLPAGVYTYHCEWRAASLNAPLCTSVSVLEQDTLPSPVYILVYIWMLW